MAGEIEKEDLEYFLAIGALEFSYISPDGEKIYHLTKESKSLAPNFYRQQMEDINSILFSLWRKNAIDISFDSDGSPLIGITEETIKKIIDGDLEQEEDEVLQEVVLSWYLKK
jgi:hypothetical protein